MSWKFWEKRGSGKDGNLSGPKGLPSSVGRDLVVKGGENPDWVWSLKCVERPSEGKENCYDVRIFDENDAAKRGISVKNYNSLDQAPELILFEGWYNKKTNDSEVGKRRPYGEPKQKGNHAEGRADV